ncbi:hypothetical protein GQX73_g7554 [Xylaria multiplex]|uniref:Uncharacterized protein n=1 Tax=Xylaria multiplex TaxID=323545 RepID=A0A7C8IKK1_9PEZI|nr:hypothetical protein GQX73_g7554 [Xylaria multiplex]
MPEMDDIEHLTDPTPEQIKPDAGSTPDYHGRNGELTASYPYTPLTGSFYPTLAATWEALGIPVFITTSGDSNGQEAPGHVIATAIIYNIKHSMEYDMTFIDA